jgi:hypothetical protein
LDPRTNESKFYDVKTITSPESDEAPPYDY